MAITPTNFNSQIGQEQFLQLLVSQLQYQNPLEPTKQENFLGQLAQFSTLSGIEQLNTSFEDMVKLQSLTQGASLVGQEVEYYSEETKDQVTGVVTAARLKEGSLVLTVGNEEVALSDVLAVVGQAGTTG